MLIPKSVLASIRGKGVITNIFYLIKELGLSYEDIREMPIPAIVALTEELLAHNKKEANAAKRRK